MDVYDLDISVSPWLIAVVVILVVAFIAFAAYKGVLAHRLRTAAGREDLVGTVAVVTEALKPRGTVFCQGELWNLNRGMWMWRRRLLLTG